jgi:hypothetical protein
VHNVVCNVEKERSSLKVLHVTEDIVSNGHRETCVIQHVRPEARGAGACSDVSVREEEEKQMWLHAYSLRRARKWAWIK